MRRHHVPGGGSILVSGNTARFIDEKHSLVEHLPLVAAIIAGTTLLLLFALTGSIILPIKTLLMNMLTLGASLGVIVFAFQDGHLDGLFDYTGPAAIEVTSLAFLFAVTFGLSTDYAVLVMARIKEQHDARRLQRGGDRARDRRDGARHHRRGGGDRHRLPRLQRQRRVHHEADRARRGRRGARRRDARAGAARAGAHAAAGGVELVGAAAARAPAGALAHQRGVGPTGPEQPESIRRAIVSARR